MNCLRFICIALITMLYSPRVNAQLTYDSCSDFLGQSVASVLDYNINDIAIATMEGEQPVIRYNPNVLSQLSEPTRQFFYIHECAHHALGHMILNPSLPNERSADCWAIQTMKNDVGLSLNRLRAIQNDIAQKGRGGWAHLPGPYRAIDIENCLDSAPQVRNPVACKHRIECQHQVQCQHRMQCTHTRHPFERAHPFDQDYYGNRYQCQHKVACSHSVHSFDTAHNFDTVHPFDTEHPYDTKHEFD